MEEEDIIHVQFTTSPVVDVARDVPAAELEPRQKLKPRHPCSVCGQLFALRSIWHEHMRAAHGITKPFDCDECGKRYSMLGALNYHRLTTHRGVVHACKTCGKRFMTKPGLVRHAKSHFGGVYVCEDCEKTYPTRDSLRRHRQQVHMGEKPHVCQICQERFGASHSLNRHIKRRHTARPGAEPAPPVSSEHTCHLCHKPFHSAEALRKHVQSMHRHAQYQCQVCLRRFYDLSNYTRHRDANTCTPAVSVDIATLQEMADPLRADLQTVVEAPVEVEVDVPHAVDVQQVVALPLVLQQLAPVVAAAADGEADAEVGQAVSLVVTHDPAAVVPTEIELTGEQQADYAVGDDAVKIEDGEYEEAAYEPTTVEASAEQPPEFSSSTTVKIEEVEFEPAEVKIEEADFVEPPAAAVKIEEVEFDPASVKLEGGDFAEMKAAEMKLEEEVAAVTDADADDDEDSEFAEFARRYGDTDPAAVIPVGVGGAGAGGDTVELQPVDAIELRALEGAALCGEGTVLLPLTLAQPLVAPLAGAGGQDVYVTLYPAGETAGHRFLCVQDGDNTVLAEAPFIAEQTLDCN